MEFGLVRVDIATLAVGIIALLGVLVISLSVALVYIMIFLRPLHSNGGLLHRLRNAIIFIVLLLLCGGTVVAAWYFASQQFLLSAIGALIAGTGIVAIWYFGCMRSLIRPYDNRIPFAMSVLGAIWLLTVIALVALWTAREMIQVETQTTLRIANVLQIISLVFPAVAIVFTYIRRTEQANRAANQQIYQTLELQSVKLFRFEADHPDLVEKLWFSPVPQLPSMPHEHTARYQLREYICQMLNLFEMAYRFRVRDIMEAEVFGSWVIWMWELCESDVFCHFWIEDGLPINYVKGFSEAMTTGVKLHQDKRMGTHEQRRKFFIVLANQIGCLDILEWLDQRK